MVRLDATLLRAMLSMLEHSASKDESRTNLAGVYLKTSQGAKFVLQACDGHQFTQKEFEGEDICALIENNSKTGQLFMDRDNIPALKACLKSLGRTQNYIESDALASNSKVRLQAGNVILFLREGFSRPSFEKLIPDRSNYKVAIALNPDLLAMISRALFSEKTHQKGLILYVKDDLSPVVVETNTDFCDLGVVMPMRHESASQFNKSKADSL